MAPSRAQHRARLRRRIMAGAGSGPRSGSHGPTEAVDQTQTRPERQTRLSPCSPPQAHSPERPLWIPPPSYLSARTLTQLQVSPGSQAALRLKHVSSASRGPFGKRSADGRGVDSSVQTGKDPRGGRHRKGEGGETVPRNPLLSLPASLLVCRTLQGRGLALCSCPGLLPAFAPSSGPA